MITISAVLLASVTIVTAACFALIAYQHAASSMIVVTTDGQILPAEIALQKEGRTIEMQHHIEKFLDAYYSYDQNNRSRKHEKAFWLIESKAGKNLHDFYTQNGWFNNVVKYNIAQQLQIESIDISGEQEPWTFAATAFIEVSREGAIPDTYKLQVSGQLINVNRDYPKNPHGLLIINYLEQPLQKIEAP